MKKLIWYLAASGWFGLVVERLYRRHSKQYYSHKHHNPIRTLINSSIICFILVFIVFVFLSGTLRHDDIADGRFFAGGHFVSLTLFALIAAAVVGGALVRRRLKRRYPARQLDIEEYSYRPDDPATYTKLTQAVELAYRKNLPIPTELADYWWQYADLEWAEKVNLPGRERKRVEEATSEVRSSLGLPSLWRFQVAFDQPIIQWFSATAEPTPLVGLTGQSLQTVAREVETPEGEFKILTIVVEAALKENQSIYEELADYLWQPADLEWAEKVGLPKPVTETIRAAENQSAPLPFRYEVAFDPSTARLFEIAPTKKN